jgi:hypothetical protein
MGLGEKGGLSESDCKVHEGHRARYFDSLRCLTKKWREGGGDVEVKKEGSKEDRCQWKRRKKSSVRDLERNGWEEGEGSWMTRERRRLEQNWTGDCA